MKTQRSIKTGIHVTRDALWLAKVRHGPGRRPELLTYQHIPLPPGLDWDAPGMPEFLRGALGKAIGSARGSDLWATLSTNGTHIRSIRFPRVAKKQIANSAFWSFKTEVPFEPLESVFDFRTEGEVIEDATNKTVATAYITTKVDVRKTRLAFEQAGYPLTGMTFPLFAAATLFEAAWAEPVNPSFGIVHIADDYSRITLVERGRLVLARSVRSGVDPLVEILIEDAPTPMDADQARATLLDMSSGPPADAGGQTAATLGRDEVLSLLRPALQRLARQIERTLSFYSVESRTPRVEHLYLTGILAPCHDITGYVAEQIGVNIHPLDPFEKANLAAELRAPAGVAERTGYALPLGLALSQWGQTPNLLHTHQEREARARSRLLSIYCFVTFLVLLAAAGGVDFWQRALAKKREAYLTSIQEQLSQTDSPITEDVVKKMLAGAKGKLDVRKRVAKRSVALASFEELSQKTPRHIKLLTAVLDLGRPPANKVSPGGTTGALSPPGEKKLKPQTLVLTGYVAGQRELLESRLVQYVIGLENSLLFEQLKLKNSQIESYASGDVLFFSLRAEIAAPTPPPELPKANTKS